MLLNEFMIAIVSILYKIYYNVAYGIVGVLVPFGLGYATLYISFSPALYIAFIGFIGIIMGIYFYNLPEFKKIDEVI